MIPLAPEFTFIDRHFRALAGPGSLDLTDDAALIAPKPGLELVLAADAMVEGVHFRPADPPHDLGRKLLRANLSDLAAMGARPVGYLLTLCVPPGRSDGFFAQFSAGLAADQAEFGLTLLGGDTTSTAGPLAMSLTIVGEVEAGRAVRRAGARAGDMLWVTGTIGDAALGLLALNGEIPDPDGALADRYHLPRPRVGLEIAGLAAACIDVSDGLLQDAMHLARAGGLAIEIECGRITFSRQARAAGPQHLQTCLAGGDDYELLIAAPADATGALEAAALSRAVPLTRIGRFLTGAPDVTVFDHTHRPMPFARRGFSHF